MKIAFTQRSDYFPERNERRDSLDQNWFKLFPRDVCIPIPNILESFKVWFGSLGPDFIILTGGNDINYSDESQNIAPERDIIEKQILSFSKQKNIPVLGVCRGLQMMNIFEGGRLRYDPKRKIEPHRVICKGYENRKQKKIIVNSYHNWIIPRHKLSNKFQILAYDEDGYIEAIKHIEYPWLGVMWHPERTRKCQSLNLVMDFVEQMR
ncbi:gamma-glutamyl-gamma-aminobutyrate hydrolase family protein [Planktomarina sp.]|nr:gamma-glutamyl-gamma-aminobutyrate hydrolase family protein [Planktomarina sp.]